MLLDYKKMPTVAALMRPFPYYAEPHTSVARIIELMNNHQIRHVPIKQGAQPKGQGVSSDHHLTTTGNNSSSPDSQRIIGIVSERDLRWLGNSKLDLPVSHEIPVCHIMTYHPYVADINTPLATVVEEMTKQKIGAAIVTKSDRLAGIVTVIDVCRAFAEILKSEFSHTS